MTNEIHDICCEDFRLSQEYGNIKITLLTNDKNELLVVRMNKSIIYYCPFCAKPLGYIGEIDNKFK